jgi:apolipoprotein N-acyltransferase
MKNFFAKYNIWYRSQQFLIFVLHIILLYWMYFTLSHSGALTTAQVLYHFIGMSIMGAGLIRGTAYWARHHYVKEIQKENESNL